MFEAISKLFTDPGPASFVNFTFLPKYAPICRRRLTPWPCRLWRCSWPSSRPAAGPHASEQKQVCSRRLRGVHCSFPLYTPLLVQLSIIYFGVFYAIQVPRISIGFIRLTCSSPLWSLWP